MIILACCLFGQNLLAQSATLNFNNNSYSVDFSMNIDGASQGQSSAMSIEINKPLDGNNHAFIDAIMKGTLIKSMTLSQSQNNGTLRINLTNASIVALSTGQSSKSSGDTFLVVCDQLAYEFTAKSGKNAISHSF